mgnify:FL=1
MSEGEEELNVGAVRLEEVASAANVSLSTASKALRGKPHVSEKTRIRVIDAAQRLGYSAAEAMASMARLSVRDSHGVQDFRVGIIGVDMKGVFSPTILIGAENAFQARSAAALLFNASGNEALFHSGIERMLVQGVSGLLIISRRTDPVHTTWILRYLWSTPMARPVIPMIVPWHKTMWNQGVWPFATFFPAGALVLRLLLATPSARLHMNGCGVRSRPCMMLDYSWLAKRGSVHGKRNGGAPLPVCCSMTVLHSTQ